LARRRLVTNLTKINNLPVADDLERLHRDLNEATRHLRLAIENVGKLDASEPWHGRSDDLSLLAEQLIDIRQQLLLLELEVGPEPWEGHELEPAS
jgi:hypothetical protein